MNARTWIAGLGSGPGPRRRVAWLGGLFIAAIVGLAILDAVRDHREAVATIGRDLQAQARVIAEQTARSMHAVDVVLRHLVEQFDAGMLPALSRDDLHRYLKEKAVGLVQTEGLVVFDADGNVRALSALPPAQMRTVSVGAEEAFQRLRDGREPGLMFANAVKSPSTGRWLFPIARPLRSASGAFAGAVSAPGRIEYFQRFYRDAHPEPSTRVSLLRRDGFLLARHPPIESKLGTRAADLDPLLPAPGQEPIARRTRSPLDGVDHFVVVRPVHEYPLVVAVSRDAAAALAPWYAQTARSALRTLALALLAALLLAVVLRQLVRLDAARRSLEVSQERYALAAAGSDDGIWDWDLRAGTGYESRRARELQGLPLEPETQPLAELKALLTYHPDDAHLRASAMQAHLDGDAPAYEVDYRVRRADGEYHWIHVRALCTRDADGRPVRLAGSVTDIDARKRAELHLRESEERYALAMAGSDEGHWLWDIAARQVYVSAKLAGLFGYAGGAQTMADDEYFARLPVHPDDRERVHRNRADHVAGLTPRLDHEFRIVLPGSAEVRWMHTRAQVFRDAEGRPARMAGVTVDATRRKRDEEALHRSEERYALAMGGLRGGHWVWEADSGALFMSAAVAELFGLPADSPPTSVSAWYGAIVLHPDDARAVRRAGRELASGVVERADFEYRILLDGQVRWISTRARAFRDADGLRVAGVSLDIGERKRTEQALRESEDRFAAAVEGSDDGIWVWDYAKGTAFASARAREIVGLQPGPELQTIDEWLAQMATVVHPDDIAGRLAAIEAHVGARVPTYQGEYRVRAADGGWRWVRSRGTCARDAAGRPLRMAGSVSDIDARRRAEEALRQSEDRFAVAVAGSDDGIWVWDYVAGTAYSSQRSRDIVGASDAPELQPLADWHARMEQLLHPDDVARRRAAMQAHVSGAMPTYEGEYRVRMPQGHYRWVRVRGMCVRDAEGRPLRFAGSVSDIDARKRVEDALRQSEDRFATAVAGSDDGIWVFDYAAGTAYASERAREIYGDPDWPELQTIDQWNARMEGRLDPEDIERRRAAVAAHLAGETPTYEFEYRARTAQGERRWVRARGMCVRDGDGRPLRFAGSVSDIDARKRAEDELRQSEERYALAMAGLRGGHWVWDVDTDRLFLSATANELYAKPRDTEPMTRTAYFADIPVHPDDQSRRLQQMDDLATGRALQTEFDYRIVLDGGKLVRWISTRAQAFRTAEGLRVAGVSIDITERKRTEEALRRSEERYQLAVDGSNEGLWDWDLGEDLLFLSPRAQRLLLPQPGEPLRPRRDWLAQVTFHPDDADAARRALAEHLRGATPHFVAEYRLLHHSGEYRWFRGRGIALRDAQGRPYRMAGSLEDISLRKHAEAERERLAQQLRQAQKLEAIGTLAGGIAHDFNNILSAILGYGEMVQKAAADGTPTRRHIDAAMSAGLRAKSLVERILAFSRGGTGERVTVPVQAVVDEALDSVAGSLPAGVTLRRELRADGAGVLGDATQIHQVVMNLCANAVHAMKGEGVLAVGAEVVPLEQPLAVATSRLPAGRYVLIEVADTGSGIEPQVLERIFDPFFTTKQVGVGTGLGLSLVHGIVTDLGGGIAVDSRVGHGTTFSIWLPWRRCDDAQADAVDDVVEPGHGETVMLVDDEEALVRLGEETLAELGYEPVGFTSAAEALAAFRAEPVRFDAVLSDEAMPGMTGSELLAELRTLRPDVPLLLMTGFVNAAIAERARANGVAEVLVKPLGARDIARCLADALGRQRATAGAVQEAA